MTIEEIAIALHDFTADTKHVYIQFSPEISDFRKPQGSLIAHARGKSLELPIPHDRLNTFVGVLSRSLFAEGRTVLAWDIKRFMSYVRFHLGHFDPAFKATVVDVKLYEAFFGGDQPAPTSFGEAMDRLRPLVGRDKYNIHSRIHVPLALRVLPAIETLGITETSGRRLYSFYHIEGQAHGRLNATKEFDGCLTPHTLSADDKAKLRPPYEKKFLVLDYKHMEVSVLQWLSDDRRLGKIIDARRDLYAVAYQLLYGKPCDTDEKRKTVKNSLLRIFYGIQPRALSEALGVTLDEATWLVREVRDQFPEASAWLDEQQERARRDVYHDYFGRPRDCRDKPWVARNSSAQGPGAVVCLEKLIELYDQLKSSCDIAATIHDAFVLIADDQHVEDIAAAAAAVLESPSQMCPGLTLRVECRVGDNLADLTPIKGA